MRQTRDNRWLPDLPAQIVLLSALFVVLVAVVTWAVVSRSQNQLIEYKALKIAEIVASQAAAARSAYAELAVSKLVRDGFGASADSDDLEGHVPLPAQFLKRLSRTTVPGADGLYRFKPVSLWNLDPDQGIVDPFQRWAWDALQQQDKPAPATPIDWEPVWRIEELAGVKTLRYLRADPAASQSCVDCHNALEQQPDIAALRENAGIEPGHRWQLNELLGAIEIDIPLDRAAALAKEQTQQGLLIVAAVSVIGLAGVSFLLFMYSLRTRTMTGELRRQARHDSLTGLPNRLDFDQVLVQLLQDESVETGSLAVMLLDLDDFKQINDTLGHEVGDEVLKATGKRLQHVIRPGDFVARLGGDEFALVLNGVSRAEAEATAIRLVSAIEENYSVGDYQLSSGASVGIAMSPDDGTDARELMRCADVAMYAAKKASLPSTFYVQEHDFNDVSRLALVNDLRDAVRNDGLTVYFQPKYSLHEGRMVGTEALLRWHHPAHGHVPPNELIELAERCGLIGDVTRFVLSRALHQCRQWRDDGYELHVAVNLSMSNLLDADLTHDVALLLDEVGLQPDALVLEVTESAMMSEPERAEQVLDDIRRLGVKLSIDDYGTGYCSLSYLSRLPVQELKLDRSFIQNLFDSERDAVIVKATLDLTHNLGLKMVAEGVEDARSLEHLRDIGCDVVQGYFLCRPQAAVDLTRQLSARYRIASPPRLQVVGQN